MPYHHLRAAGCRPYEDGGGAEGKERRQNRNRIRSVRYRKLSVYCPHSSSVKNQRFLTLSPRGKALDGGRSHHPYFYVSSSRQRTVPRFSFCVVKTQNRPLSGICLLISVYSSNHRHWKWLSAISS